MAVRILFCLFLFIPLAKQSSTQDNLEKVISSIELMTDFFQKDYQNLNLDGLFGLRVLEGHLGAILKKYENGELQHLSKIILSRIQTLKTSCTRICQSAIDDVKSDDKEYFQKMSYIVGSPWSLFENVRKRIDPGKIWGDLTYHYAKTSGMKVDETTSDECMAELMGSHKKDGEPCDISAKCARIMTHPGLLGYGLTHQILWTMLAEKAGCRNHLESSLKEIQRGTINSVRLELCTNNFVQVVSTVSKLNGVVLPPLQDLFLEELFVCPSLGFYEFLDIELLPQILSWQDKSGCFAKLPWSNKDKMAAGLSKDLVGDYDYDDQEDEDVEGNESLSHKAHGKGIDLQPMMDSFGARGHGQAVAMVQKEGHIVGDKAGRFTGRKLLIEKEMSDGCLAHKTAVASGALVMYLRFLCEPDAALIFNKSRSFQTLKSILPKTNQTGVVSEQVVKKSSVELSTIKQPLVFNDKEGFVNNTDVDIQDVHQKVLDNGKKFLHKETFGKQHLGDNIHQIMAPKIHGKLYGMNADANTVDNGDDNEEDYDNEDDEDDYDYNNDEDDEDEDGYYDNDTDKPGHALPHPGVNDYHEKPVEHFELLKQFQRNIHDTDIDGADDGYVDDNDDDDDDDEGDEADYVDNNEKEAAHPHINARNIGQNRNHPHNHAVDDQYEKSINHDKDHKDYTYDDEDEDEDDYEYDDENDNDVNKQENINTDIKHVDSNSRFQESKAKLPKSDLHISNNSVSPRTAFIVFFVSFLLILLLMYRFIRKRRIRIRFNPKYFHV